MRNHLFLRLYDVSIKWGGADAFVTQVAAALNLPNGWGRYRGANDLYIDDLRQLSCDTFTLTAGLKWFGGRKLPVVLWSDMTALDEWLDRVRSADERGRRAEEQRRRTFKP